MVDVNELQRGNLVRWNPALVHPGSTLSVQVVEVVEIQQGHIGYVPVNFAHRVEPFQDDLLQKEPVFKDAAEFEPIPVSSPVAEVLHQQSLAEEHAFDLHQQPVTYLHQYQNKYQQVTGEAFDTSLLHHILDEV